MLGAVAGDIFGSPWEGGQCPPGRFDFFSMNASATDDTVCTVAIADALLHESDIAATLRAWVRRYPGYGYGSWFASWAWSSDGPYESHGNGGAMRVSAAGLLAHSLDEANAMAKRTAEVTHNHPEGIRGAQAIAGAIWLARQGLSAFDMRRLLAEQYRYDLTTSVAGYAAESRFDLEARVTVPQALVCALEANCWDDAILNAVTIGGDSDTIACMAGGIAEARFGLPLERARRAWALITPDMHEVLIALYARAGAPTPWLEETSKAASPGATASMQSSPEPWLARVGGRLQRWLLSIR